MNKKRILTRAVLILSAVSLFTDIASEMLYPVMPVYLKSIGFSVVLIGVLEGFAEALAGLSKGYFGHLSDQSGKRVPFVRTGYLLSALSKPMMALAAFAPWVFMARSIDRLGKGIRTSARDALLSDEATKENKGRVFGFHRGMDTLGATIGPILALVFLHYHPGDYKTLFLLAFPPGILAVLFTFMIREKKREAANMEKSYSFFHFFRYWSRGTTQYRYLVCGLLVFTLMNSSDVFLLLVMKEKGLSDQELIQVYIFYNFIYALLSYPLGSLGDRIGLKKTFIIGLLLFALVYTGMSFNRWEPGFYILFFLYGAYAASTEGISKAWISNMADKSETATAIGLYSALNSLMAIAASTLAGLIWKIFSPDLTFLISGIGVLFVALYFAFSKKV